jgi:SAM-dependent methyltransferase
MAPQGDSKASADDAPEGSAPASIPLAIRLKAWWNGYEPSELYAFERTRDGPSGGNVGVADMHRDVKARQLEVPDEKDDDDPIWPDSRIDVIQRLFGRGFIHPGGAERMAEICKPFGLTPQQSVMDLSAGLGGGPASLSEFFGVWVTAYERNAKLVGAAPASIKGLRGAEKVKVEKFDTDAFEPKQNSVDCVVCRDTLYQIQDKVGVLDGVKKALRQGGQILLTDYIAPDDSALQGRLKEWAESSEQPVWLWPAERYEQALADRGFDVRISEDLSPLYSKMIRQAFVAFVDAAGQSMQGGSGEIYAGKPRRRAALLQEAERWAFRAALLDAGHLKVHRLFALKPM